MFDWQCDREAGAFAGLAFGDNFASVAFDNLLADRQTYPGAFVLAAPMQSLKDAENPVGIFLLEPDAIVRKSVL